MIRLRLTAIGDIMFGRDQTFAHFPSADVILGEDVKAQLAGDIVTGNLECVLTDSGGRNSRAHSHFSAGADFARPLLERFHVLNLANNHIYDFLDRGVADTLHVLDEFGIASVGIGLTPQDARTPRVVSQGPTTAAVFGATTVPNVPPGGSRYSIAVPDQRLFDNIAEAARRHHHVILHLHAGDGDFRYPSPQIRALHQRCHRAGVQIIVGHHPHVFQAWDQSDSTVSFYSLGDFVFDRTQSGRDSALVAKVDLSDRPPRVSVIPVSRATNLQVHLPDSATDECLRELILSLRAQLDSGDSDDAYYAALGSSLRTTLLASVQNDFRSGGLAAVLHRLRRASPQKLARLVRGAAVALRPRPPGGAE